VSEKGDDRRLKRPFRDTALFYGALAVVGFGFLLFSGQDAVRSAFGAGAAFVLATSWTWWRFSRQRAEREE